jgi:hypothetical protein
MIKGVFGRRPNEKQILTIGNQIGYGMGVQGDVFYEFHCCKLRQRQGLSKPKIGKEPLVKERKGKQTAETIKGCQQDCRSKNMLCLFFEIIFVACLSQHVKRRSP